MKNTEKKNNLTELVFILDRSGSMSGLESDTIGGFNSLIEKHKGEEGKALVTTVLFNDGLTTVHDRVPLSKIKKMTNRDYVPCGSTALLDAIGETVEHIDTIHKYIREEDVPQSTMFVITTDGFENASRKYTSDMVKEMIKGKENKGWTFLFLGANIDAVETARSFGISEDNAVDYHCDAAGTAVCFEALDMAVSDARACRPVSKGWKRSIENDFKKRK